MKSLRAFCVLYACTAIATAQSAAPSLASGPAVRILDQASWGPTQPAIADLQSKGLANWLNEQFSAAPSIIPDQPAVSSPSLSANQNMAPLVQNFFMNAVYGPDQLRQRVAFALSEIWVVSEVNVGNASAFPPLLRIFQSDAFGNYETLMHDLTLNPAMGQYLNLANNIKAGNSGGAPSENYARELLQLFSIGATQLNPDGSAVLDANGNPVEAYGQATVSALARALTGWTYPSKGGLPTRGQNPSYFAGQMIPVEANHDTQQKTLFGTVTLPAGQSASNDLTQALHTVFLQPSLPPFISRQLIQHLVTSNPSPAYVQRIAAVFTDNGAGVRGDLKTVVAAILTDPEARAADDLASDANPNFGHLREPVLLEANLLRGLGLPVPDGDTLLTTLDSMGQKLFYSPAVTSYFSPSYRTAKNVSAPEFEILSTQTAANRLNVIAAAVASSNSTKLVASGSTPAPADSSTSPATPVTVNVVTLGAKNDRSADASGVFNQAIGLAANGGTVVVPAGTYSIRGQIRVTQTGVTIACQPDAKLIADGNTGDVIQFLASQNDVISGCIIDGNNALYGVNGIGADGYYYTQNGATSVAYVQNIRITNNVVQNCSGSGIFANFAHGLEIDNNTVTGGNSDPIAVDDYLQNVSIHNNTVTTTFALAGAGTHGIGVHSTPNLNGPVQSVQVFENTIFQGAGNFCIEVLGLGGAQPIYNATLHDNRCTFEGPGQGYINGMDSLGQVQGGTVQHEILNANGISVGIDFVELTGNTNNVTVDGNLMYNGSTANGGAIDVNGGSNNTISNNVMIGSGTIYIGGSGNSGTGVPCSNNVLKNNVVLVSKNFGWSRGTVWVQENFQNNPATDNGHYTNNQILDNYLVANNPSAIQIGIALENDYYSATATDPAMILGTVISGNHIYNNAYGLGQFSQWGSVSGTQSLDNVVSSGATIYAVLQLGNNATASGDTQTTAPFDPSVIIPILNNSFFNSSMSAGLQQSMKLAMNSMPDTIDKANAAVDIALSSGEFQAIEQAVMANSGSATASVDTQIQTINNLFFHGSMSTNLASAATQAASSAETSAAQTQAALYVALTSSEFQVIH